MLSIIPLIIITTAALIALLLTPKTAHADSGTYTWTGAWSRHIGGSGDLNESHRLLAVEHRDWIGGYFRTSFDDDAAFVGRKFNRSVTEHIEASALVGINWGYRSSCTNSDFDGKKRVCPMFVPAVTYTGYRLKPSFMAIGDAATVSVRWEF